MLKRLVFALLLLGALGYGLTELFLLRFTSGNVYPPYSTLRTDPLGTKALYAALEDLPQWKVHRNLRAITKLQAGPQTTLLYVGTPVTAFWQPDELRYVEQLVTEGARVVITFLPLEEQPAMDESKPPMKEDKKGAAKGPKKAGEIGDAEALISFADLAKRWGFELKYSARRGSQAPPRRVQLFAARVDGEPALSWHSALNFGALSDRWRAIYAFEKKPVIIERDFGAGSIVLAADSYFLSNEALRKERAPRLLTWLVGPAQTILFDEESHGVREDPGIATLMRRYGLHGVAAGLLLLAALFVWKNALPFVPATADAHGDGDLVIGQQADEGLTSLLRRAVPPAQVLAVCAEEWKKGCDPAGQSPHRAQVEKVLAAEQARSRRDRDPVAAYRTIRQLISRKT